MRSRSDPFDLQRFVAAQEPVFEQALEEMGSGRKQSHWMWFVFPQLCGLGGSETSRFYGIASLAEAQAYLAHPVLGPRLLQATEAVLWAPADSLRSLFGAPDDRKFRSCMTLFSAAAPEEDLFRRTLDEWRAGGLDPRTLSLLREADL